MSAGKGDKHRVNAKAYYGSSYWGNIGRLLKDDPGDVTEALRELRWIVTNSQDAKGAWGRMATVQKELNRKDQKSIAKSVKPKS